MSAPVHPSTPLACLANGSRQWSASQADAWIGLLETHKRLTRELDAELERRHGLGLSGVEVLGRLAAAQGGGVRLSSLAGETGLSLSRISRVVDVLERRALVQRRPCASDARAVEAHLTESGGALAGETQVTHLDFVRRRFFDQLESGELDTLARVFGRMAPADAVRCVASAFR
jgi:DNA-binding MarR family transcriptional regulator